MMCPKPDSIYFRGTVNLTVLQEQQHVLVQTSGSGKQATLT